MSRTVPTLQWDELVTMAATLNDPENECETCAGGGYPGTIAPIATNGDDGHLFVECCGSCGRFDSNFDAACVLAYLLDLVVRKRFDEKDAPYFHTFLARKGSYEDVDWYCIDADEFGTFPKDEVPIRA